ncbi:MAG: DUF4249 family protein [Candidatus Cryptobacteroides sp.]
MKIQNMAASLLALFIASAAAVSCEEEIEFNGKYSGEKLVVFSTVNPDSARIAVTVGGSKFFLAKDDGYDRRRLSGASVTVQTRDRTMQLTEVDGNPGMYAGWLEVREGEEVSVSASYGGFPVVRSRTEVPCRPDFEIVSRYSKVLEQQEAFRTVARHFKIKVKDHPERKEYYQFRIYSTDEYGVVSDCRTLTSDVAFLDSDNIEDMLEGNNEISVERMVVDEGMLGSGDRIIDFWVEDYQVASSLIYTGDNPPGGNEVIPEAIGGDEEEFISNLGTLSISVSSYSEDLYKYVKSLEAYWNMNGLSEVFGEPVCIHNNIVDGIGCFGGIASRTLE